MLQFILFNIIYLEKTTLARIGPFDTVSVRSILEIAKDNTHRSFRVFIFAFVENGVTHVALVDSINDLRSSRQRWPWLFILAILICFDKKMLTPSVLGYIYFSHQNTEPVKKLDTYIMSCIDVPPVGSQMRVLINFRHFRLTAVGTRNTGWNRDSRRLYFTPYNPGTNRGKE